MELNSTLGTSHEFSFKNFIPQHLINYLCDDCERYRTFDPSNTLYCFLFQILNSCSAKATLLNFNIQRSKSSLKTVSMNTASYIKARMRLDEDKLKYIAKAYGQEIDNLSSSFKFKNRDTYIGDGAVISLEDNEQIKQTFPITFRMGRQQGYPKMRFLGLFSLSSGAFIDGEIGAYCGKGQAETSLFKKINPRLKRNSILLLDRFFTNYNLRKDIVERGNDYVIRARDKRAQKVLGRKKDITIHEKKDKKDSGLQVRYMKSTIKRDGFRPSTIYITTSLLKEDGHSFTDIEALYLKRWSVELDIRHLKQTLDAAKLKSKTPEGVRKELWVTLLAYNMVRKMNNINGLRNDQAPRKQAFKIYIECLKQIFTGAVNSNEIILYLLTENEILNSPYRLEPRLKKYRVQKYKELKIGRDEFKEKYKEKSKKVSNDGPSRGLEGQTNDA
jgi:hypothetical protein